VTVYGNESSCEMRIWTGFADRIARVNVSFPIPNIAVDKYSYDNHGGSLGITLFVHGNTDNIQELVRSGNNYRVRILFKNLHWGRGSQFRGGGSALEHIIVDVQAIEIIKVR